MRRQSPVQDFSTVLSTATRFVIRGSLLALLTIMQLTNAQAHPPNTSWSSLQHAPEVAPATFLMQCTNSNASAGGVTIIGGLGGGGTYGQVHQEVHDIVNILLNQFSLPTNNPAGQPAQLYNVGKRTIQMSAWAPIDACQPVMCTLTLDAELENNYLGSQQPLFSPAEWSDIHSHGPFSIYEPAPGTCLGPDVDCCPPWDQTSLGSMLDDVPPTAGLQQQYVNTLAPTPVINTHMQAFADYAHALNPNVESMNLAFVLVDCVHDNPNPPTVSGCPGILVDDVKLISWTEGGTTGAPSNYYSYDSANTSPLQLAQASDILEDGDQTSDPNKWYILFGVPILRYTDGSFKIPENCPIVFVQINHKYAFKKSSPFRSRRISGAPRILKDARTTSRAELDSAPGGRELGALLDKMSEGPGKTGWTPWLNRDRQSGKGDYETLSGHLKNGAACESPSDVQCRATKSKEDWRKTEETYHCSTEAGGYCNNRDQSDRRCQDYEVRFMCPIE